MFPSTPVPSDPHRWDRAAWLGLTDHLIASARPYASPGNALITLPGAEGGYGRAVDGLEGFARTFLLAGFRLAGEKGAGLDELADFYARGVATGTDPHAPDRWVRLDEHSQAKVEAASIALILDMTRPWIWDRLDAGAQERVVDYLAHAVGDATYPRINWVWFRLVVQTFLRSVGGPHELSEMADDLATHDSFRRADGWLADGAHRAYDHYAGWALHLYPVLWSRMAGAADLAEPRRADDVARLDRYLTDAIALVGADGSPLLQGRSLIYRFAAAAPFWAGVLAEVPSLTPGQLRHAATGVVRHFTERGAPDERGLLTLGWHAPWPRLAQSYSGPGSPYWAGKGLLGVSLPADHPVWSAPEEPLPVESGDVLRAVRAPGWLISGTRSDGIVRVINHGTDHSVTDAPVADSPLYARLGYSTATVPTLDEDGYLNPVDQSVTLVDEHGRRSHRSGLRTLRIGLEGPATARIGIAGSTARTHWLDPGAPGKDHGGGRPGTLEPAGRITVYSLVRGPWEIRLVRVDDVSERAVGLRISGWPLPTPTSVLTSGGYGAASQHTPTGVWISGGYDAASQHTGSGLAPLAGLPATPGVSTHDDAGPLGRSTQVPWLDYPVPDAGEWIAVLLELSRGDGVSPPGGRAEISATDDGWQVGAVWPDGLTTHTSINESRVKEY
ncbi:DUF2264 domain-containing protein [Actinoplanes rectilineatus]|uniref:DUF2264 domain-containing protein n=1 Tax=Actinoplanes rectilineatus TaxID=113571 RepID=UPI0005F2B05A|nr:DUF2264 domain-containing protein [Actinoplanes rectilineatus]